MKLSRVHVESVGPTSHVRLSGEPLSRGEARELEVVFTELAEDPGVRAVLLGTSGPDFCAGAGDDLDPLGCGLDPAAAIAGFPAPVVVALRGQVGSVGLELALAGDLRVGEPGIQLSLSDVFSGRLPCWGGTQRLPRLAGRSMASLMILTGTTLDADAALRCGLVQDLAEDADAAATALVARLGELAPWALAATKEALTKGPELPMRAALELEGDLNHLLQTTADRAEGLHAFFAKRDPRFSGR